jgi:hypothetical protein
MFLLKKKNNKKEERSAASSQNPKILEVNLVKDEILISFDWRRHLLILLLVLFLGASLCAEIYFGLNWWETQEAAQAQLLADKTAAVNIETNKLKNQIGAVIAYKAKSAAFSELLTEHTYWTNFFSWLEKNTLSSVKYEEFAGDLTGRYTLNATAASYADVSWQVKTFLNDPLTEKVTVDTVSADSKDKAQTSGVNFKLFVQVKPEVFKK